MAGLLALAAYLIVGVAIPVWNGRCGSQMGMEFRTNFGELNSFVLDSLRGLDETIQYGQGEKDISLCSVRNGYILQDQCKVYRQLISGHGQDNFFQSDISYIPGISQHPVLGSSDL